MKKQFAISLVLIIVLALSACGSTNTEVNSDAVASSGEVASTSVEATTSSEVALDPKVEEELKVLSQSVEKLETIYNEVAAIAKDNGWEADELYFKEKSAAEVIIQVSKETIADPSMLEGGSAQDFIDGAEGMATEWDTNIREKVSKTYEPAQ